VDQFVLPRLTRIRRPVEPIPRWREAAPGNWPGILAVLVAVLFGAWGLQLFPGQSSAPSLGLVPVEAWLIAGLLYLVLATALSRATQPRATQSTATQSTATQSTATESAAQSRAAQSGGTPGERLPGGTFRSLLGFGRHLSSMEVHDDR
jgi:hypothetical protein